MEEMFAFGKSWRQIPKYNGYFASKDGQILSLAKNQNRPYIMKQIVAEDGHRYVLLYREKKAMKMFVHRAVLMAWDRMPEPGEEARHLNDDPSENALENLSWGSRQENVDDKRKNGRLPLGEDSAQHKLTEAMVMDIRSRYADGESSSNLGAEYGIARNTVLSIVRGETWGHLPLIPVVAEHKSKRKTPIGQKEIAAGTVALARSTASRKKKRELIPCACGCGQMIMSVDSHGREHKYARGHNQKGRSWRWRDDKNKN